MASTRELKEISFKLEWSDLKINSYYWISDPFNLSGSDIIQDKWRIRLSLDRGLLKGDLFLLASNLPIGLFHCDMLLKSVPERNGKILKATTDFNSKEKSCFFRIQQVENLLEKDDVLVLKVVVYIEHLVAPIFTNEFYDGLK